MSYRELVLKLDTRKWDEAMSQVASAMETLAQRAREAGNRIRRLFAPMLQSPPGQLPHGFRPDYDLGCTVTGCTAFPEDQIHG